jgi:putative aldouronate transport system permease protein
MKSFDLNHTSKIFKISNYAILSIAGIMCLLPFIHILAVSLSSNTVVAAGKVTFMPIEFTFNAYKFLLKKVQFWNSFGISTLRVLIGGAINIFIVLTMSYPLSKSNRYFRSRTFYAWFIFFTALFSGGLIPLYQVVYKLGLIGSIWALVLPCAVPVFNIILMLNFFRQIPSELEEASYIDGCGHWRTLFQIFIPCSIPAIATIVLFTVVGHWNSWFDGLIFSNRPEQYPLQSYLQTIIIGMDFSQGATGSLDELANLSDKTLKSAQIIIATIPIIALYPMLQRYFISGIVVGSVKG